VEEEDKKRAVDGDVGDGCCTDELEVVDGDEVAKNNTTRQRCIIYQDAWRSRAKKQ
jgi:hypothetical protein